MTARPDSTCSATSRQIQRALHNLVSNAVKFTPARGRIEVVARSERRRWSIEVPIRESASQSSTRTSSLRDSSTPRPDAGETLGTGLGLYLVKQIVEGHGGTVGVRVGSGTGSTFTMRFPRPAEGRDDLTAEIDTAQPAAGVEARRDPRANRGVSRIVVVDDDPDVRELIEYKLVQSGHEVPTSRTARRRCDSCPRCDPSWSCST